MNAGRSFHFDPDARGLEVFLGPTEAKLMEQAWKHGTITVKKALFYLGDESARAYTTVMTVLKRLADKGLLSRHKAGRSFAYTPTATREEFLAERVRTVTGCLRKNFKSYL